MRPFLDPIDLTQDDDLQKALALSLQDMQHQNGGISLEEQELSRYVLWLYFVYNDMLDSSLSHANTIYITLNSLKGYSKLGTHSIHLSLVP